jgi:tetratricopeptide (TPR) repeat protein
MPGFTALTLGVVAIIILASVALFVWRASKRAGAAESPTLSGEAREGKVYDVAEAEALAAQAEAEGDCELAAELLESVGMLRRATDLYRRSGNIQKAAELELESLQLTRLANDVPDSRPMPGDVAWEDAGLLSDPPMPLPSTMPPSGLSMPAVRMASLVPTSLPPTSLPAARLSTVPPHSPSTFPPLSLPPRMSSRPPARAKSSIPPRRGKSSRPPKPISNRPRARTPTVDELLAMLARFPEPGLGNIEIYYRLGLAYLAQQDLEQARRAFLTVEDISPGYRDTAAYLEQLLPAPAEKPAVTRGTGPANNNAHTGSIRERNVATGRRRDER